MGGAFQCQFSCTRHGSKCGVSGLANAADDLGNLLCRFRCTFSQLANFVSDDGKPPPLFAGACRLDSGIQRQKVGLIGNFADGLNNAAYAGHILGKLFHGHGGLGHPVGDFMNGFCGD